MDKAAALKRQDFWQALGEEPLHENVQLAWDTIMQKPTQGIPSWLIHLMEHAHIERLAGAQPGEYARDPERVYLAAQRAAGTCLLDQFIPDNPLTMGGHGYESAERGATTGAEQIVLDGIRIETPESVVEHLERFEFPRLRRMIGEFDEDSWVDGIIRSEAEIQRKLGPTILKSGHGFVMFPGLAYTTYGYVPYFTALGIFPDVIERHFELQADWALLVNQAVARAYQEAGLPPLFRLDHDMADSRGLLVNPRVLDRVWFPHFVRCLQPLLQAGVRLIWHCDGNLMDMVPRLLEVGIAGFQGFQYEDGMDYERICRFKTREGRSLIIIAGVSVTRTLPFGGPQDVKRELEFLVRHGPPVGLFLGGSSSIAPGVRWENIEMLVEGLRYYRKCGRGIESRESGRGQC